MAKTGPLEYRYAFHFPNGRTMEFPVSIDPKTLNLVSQNTDNLPQWTRLEHHQCSHCPLNKKDHPRCPVAVNLVTVIESFKDIISFEECEATVSSSHRTYSKKGPVQKALSSMLGLFMVTNTCPIMAKLKPMVRFHLPFASVEETFYRAVSMHLVAQFLLYKKKKKPDWDLENLSKIYQNIQKVNHTFSKRLRDEIKADSNMNAIAILDCFTMKAVFEIDLVKMKALEGIFEAYLD